VKDIFEVIEAALVEHGLGSLLDAVVYLPERAGVYIHLAGRPKKEGWFVIQGGPVGEMVIPEEALAELEETHGDDPGTGE
jgi:hypothetical protein